MRVYINDTINGIEYPIDVRHNIKVAELKRQIYMRGKENYYGIHFYIIYKAQLLYNYDNLNEYGIKDGDKIRMNFYSEGGGEMWNVMNYGCLPLENDNFLTYIHAVNKRGNIGNTYYYKIKGSNEGTVWGDNIYTDDSNIAKAAVLEGKCELGQEKIVGIKMLEGKSSYSNSYKNGIKSIPYGSWPASYIFIL